MASEAQIKANRANSQKSTGPKTAEGKLKVSQNARKHGLFASPTVIKGEDQGEFDQYCEAMLGEMRPVGPAESMLAERFVSLSWRLRRAERMQDEALKMQIKTDHLDLVVRQIQWSYREANGLPQEESYPEDDHMTLGRAARNDIANYRVLDRLMLYERRIENSMYKTMKELGNLQSKRKAEQDDAGREQPAQASPPAERHSNELKKQSEYAPALMGVKSVLKQDYDNKHHTRSRRSKPKQSRSRGAASVRMAGSIRCSSKGQGRLAFGQVETGSNFRAIGVPCLTF